MPATFVARRDTAYLLAAARLAQAQQLAAVAAAQTDCSSAAGAEHKQPGGQAGDSTEGGAPAGTHNTLSGAAAAGFADAALAALPQLLDDPVLLRELLAKWNARLAGLHEAATAEAKVRTQPSAACRHVGHADGPC